MGWRFDKDRIQMAMDARDVSPLNLAKSTSVTVQQLEQWLSGDVSPGMESFTKIINALDTPPKFFFVQISND